MYLHALTSALAQAEPAPSGWATTESLVRHAESRPDVAFPLIAAISPLLVIGALLFVLFKHVLPIWREEEKLDREQQDKALQLILTESASQASALRELARVQLESIVSRIEHKIDRHGYELDRLADRLRDSHTTGSYRVQNPNGG